MDEGAGLAELIGAAHVALGEEALAYYASDIMVWEEARPPVAAVRPGSAAEVAAIVRYAGERKLALVPRGAGLSYTGGVVAGGQRAIVLDLTRLDGVDIDAENRTVRVGAGLSWEGLALALAGGGLRPLQHGPISGQYSTVGGAVSQNVPGNLEGVLGLEVVLADASVARFGAGGIKDAPGFYRHYGPDLVGLFCGDCGSFGIKTAVTLRLVPERPAAFASFAFPGPRELVAAMATLGRANLGLRLFGMDAQKNRDATKVDAQTAFQTVRAVLGKGGNPLARVGDLLQLGRAGANTAGAGWTLHATAEAATPQAAASLLDAARRELAGAGVEIDNVLPKTLHAKPYSVRGFVGREGERWVPIHGMVSLQRAVGTIGAIEDYLAANAERLAALSITTGYFFSGVGPYVSMEPMFYWPDELDPIHLRYLSNRNRERFGGRDRNAPARQAVWELRDGIRGIFREAGAVHAQIARYYDYLGRIDPSAAQLVTRIKGALDPQRLINPGSLGL
ncbi:FAD-binding oxidoreductase [Devosia honganensis]|uniref:FAD-binding oxidoreductase n=1 Tax=Devosia honganensis TaxID=1610527 RepID=A0ABV7WXD1_9HYPH